MKLNKHFQIKKKFLILIMILSFNVLSFSTLFAASRGDKVFSIGVRETITEKMDSDENNYFTGIQVRAMIAPSLVLEGSLDYREETIELYHQKNTIKTYPLQATLIGYLIPSSPVTPYILGGAGLYFHQFNGDLSLKADNVFGLHAGFGLEIMLSENISIDSSYRYIWLEDVETEDAPIQDKSYNAGGGMLTLALNILI